MNTLQLYFLLIIVSSLSYANCLVSSPSAIALEEDHNKKPPITLKAERATAARPKLLLRGEINMLFYASKEAGLTLASNNLPTTIKNVETGSPAYFANISTRDKVVAVDYKEDKLCLTLERNGTPYYTEIRLPSLSKMSASDGSGLPQNITSRQGTNNVRPFDGQRIAMGFRFYPANGQVHYIDPNSDLYGKVHVGDIYVSDRSDLAAIASDANMAYPKFSQNGIVHQYTCRRKPIQSFAANMVERFMHDNNPVYVAPFVGIKRPQ